MPNPFVYQPLDEHSEDIRILTLHPASLSNDILISIHHEGFKADQSPEYEAISYVWGSPEKTESIGIMDGDTKVLSVTQSLDIALQHLRHRDTARKLWIDAICIDQSNLEERGLQVQRMWKIYKRAERVVVWLGPEADDSTHAMSLMRSLASKVEIDWDTFAVKPSFDGADEPDWADRSIQLPYTRKDWHALYCLLTRAWFGRLWVRQEINFSGPDATVLCGTATILWQDLRKANFLLMVNVYPSDVFLDQEEILMQTCSRRINDMAYYRPSFSTWSTLRDAGSSDCFDPKDKVYANLGLIQEAEGDIGLKPDYKLSVPEVHIQLVLALLKHHKRLDILRCCELLDEQGDLPSWTPNWNISTMDFRSRQSDAFAPANARYLGEGVLRVEGIVGGVLATIDIYQENIYREDICSEIHRIALEHVLGELARDDDVLLDSFCRSLGGGDFRDNYPDDDGYPTWQKSRQTLSDILRTKGGWTEAHDNKFLAKVDHYGHGRCFFTTKDGKVGWAPKSARAGDIVCVILGCEVPLVLRETGEARYQVVGECYMDGIMDGELVLGSLPENLRTVQCLDRDDGMWYVRWVDTVTGDVHNRDPRRAKFVKEGESGNGVRLGTALHYAFLTSERLKEAGVKIRSFDLV